MDLLSSNAVRVFITVFVVLFSGGLVYRVEGQRTVKVANLGSDITLRCYPPRGNYKYYCWYKGPALLAYIDNGNFQQYQSRISQSFTADHSQLNSQYNLYITDVNDDDSATYQCFHGYNACKARDEGYDLRVIGCSCAVAGVDAANMTNGKVVCELLNYVPPTLPSNIRSILVTKKQASNTDIQIVGSLLGNFFSFSISRNDLDSNLKVELNPYDNAIGNIVCTVPAQLTSPRPFTHHHTTLPTPTTRNRLSAVSSTVSPPASRTASEKITTNEPTKYPTPPHKISSQDNSTGTGNITLVIVSLGALFLLVLIVIIVVVICKKTKNRHKSKSNRNVSIDNQVVTEEVPEHAEDDYELTEDESRKEPEYTTSIEMLRKSNKDGKDADYLSIDVSTANVPHDYMALIPTSSRFTESETTDNQTCDMAEYVNSSIRDQPKWNGVSPKPEDQYDDVSIPEIRDDGDENLVYSDI